MLAIFVAFWIVMAIDPVERKTWLIENILIFVWLPLIILSWFKTRLSTFSYLLIFIFLMCHTLGAHYTYAKVPFGYTLGSWVGSERNHYDRLIHFAFGALLYYPCSEFMKIKLHTKNFTAYLLPALVVIFISDMYEIVEWITTLVVAPKEGSAYLGTQGDEWDAQKDMGLGVAGVILALALHLLWQKRQRA
jgi:putative membrane protein